jgi:nitroreductase
MSEHALFQDVIRKRRSVRKFEPGRSISRDVLQRIVDCGRWAPSGANVQCWDFIVVDDPIVRDRVMDVFLRQAQRLVALHSDSDGLGPTVRLARAGVSDQRGPRCCEESLAAF